MSPGKHRLAAALLIGGLTTAMLVSASLAGLGDKPVVSSLLGLLLIPGGLLMFVTIGDGFQIQHVLALYVGVFAFYSALAWFVLGRAR
jgi:hypothetical protein